MGVESGPLQERLEKWAKRLQNIAVSPLTRDYPDYQTPELSRRAIEAFESLKPSEGVQNAVLAPSFSGSGFTVFLTAFVVLVARITGDEDIAVATSSSDDGRPFVLRVPVDFGESFLQLQAKVEKVCSVFGEGGVSASFSLFFFDLLTVPRRLSKKELPMLYL